HAPGPIFVEELDAVHLAVAAREGNLDAVLCLERRGERPHDLIDDEIGVVGYLDFLLRFGGQVGAGVGGGGGGGAKEKDANASNDTMSDRHDIVSPRSRLSSPRIP